MTGTYKSAVFDNCILNAFNPVTVSQPAWPAHTHGAATAGTTCMLSGTKNSGNGIAKSTDIDFSNVTQTSGSGYTTGGYDPTTTVPTLSGAAPNVAQFGPGSITTTWGSTATFSALTAEWTSIPNAAGIATTTNPLLCYNDLSSATGTALSVVSGTLTLTWAGTGVMTIAISAEA